VASASPSPPITSPVEAGAGEASQNGPDASAPARPLGVAQAAPYLQELEGLRGVAMLLVVGFHTDGLVNLITNRPTAGEVVSSAYALLRAGGDLGVDVFFVLSSFLLSLPFLRAAGGPAPSTRRFFAKRALRILPLYYAAVLAGALVNADRIADLTRALPYVLFLNSFAGMTSPLMPFSAVWWSLATEWQFYLVLPVAAWLCRSASGRWVAALGLLGWAAAYAAWLAGWFATATIDGHLSLGFSLFGRAPAFLGGALVAWIYKRRGERVDAPRPHARAVAGDLAVLVIIAATGWLLQWKTTLGMVSQQVPWHAYHVLQAAGCTALLALTMLAPTHLPALLRRRTIVHLGVLSYSMYMLHVPVLMGGFAAARRLGIAGLYAGWGVRSAVAAAVVLAACTGLSELTYRVIERPFLARKERLTGRPSTSALTYRTPPL